jgi:hypothetical protein
MKMKKMFLFILFYFIILFIISTSQQELNVCNTAFKYQLLILAYFILLASLIFKRAEQQKSKMELFQKLNS